jgi:hypothetical protein
LPRNSIRLKKINAAKETLGKTMLVAIILSNGTIYLEMIKTRQDSAVLLSFNTGNAVARRTNNVLSRRLLVKILDKCMYIISGATVISEFRI